MVLAGGRGRRLGGHKALVDLGGRPMAAYPADALRAVTRRVVVVAKADTALPVLPGVERWVEPQGDHHPLHGVVHALRRAHPDDVVVCAVDLPLVAPGVLGSLIAGRGESAAVVARAGGRLQPLCALYRQAACRPLAAAARDGEAVTRAVEALEPVVVDVDEALLLNVNGPGDVRAAAAALAARA